MDITVTLILSNSLVLLVGSVFVGKIQDDMIKTLYYKYNEVWKELGAPGGWLWRPPGRGWLENEVAKMKFWNKNSYSFERPDIVPKEILGFHRRYYSIIGVVIVIFVSLNISINVFFLMAKDGG